MEEEALQHGVEAGPGALRRVTRAGDDLTAGRERVPTRPTATAPTFSNQREAQQYYESIGGPGSDPDRLDADDDGQACDSLPCPCGSGSAPPEAEAEAPTRSDSRPDYLGDRRGHATGAGDNLRGLSFISTGRGARVTLTTDVTQDKLDRYGRLLAYVTRHDEKNLGEAQIRAGWAKVYVFDRPFKLVDRFRAAARAAKRADRGVWGLCGGDVHSGEVMPRNWAPTDSD